MCEIQWIKMDGETVELDVRMFVTMKFGNSCGKAVRR